MSYGVGRRHGSDAMLLWLWCKLAALIQPLAWEPPYATGGGSKKEKKKKKNFISLALHIVTSDLVDLSLFIGGKRLSNEARFFQQI